MPLGKNKIKNSKVKVLHNTEIGGGIHKIQGGNWQQAVVRARKSIKWSTPQTWMDKVKT